MSENFNKPYEEYFRSLEQQLNKKNNASKPETIKSDISYQIKKIKKSHARIRIRKSVLAVFSIIVIGAVLISVFAPKLNSQTNKNPSTSSEIKTEKKEEVKKDIVYSFSETTQDIGSENDAKSSVVVNITKNKIIAVRNADAKVFPASTTKVMTLLTAVESIKDFDDTFTMSYAVTDPLFIDGASMAGFLNNEAVTMTDLLYGLILPSGADAAVGLAIKIAGSEEAFVDLMNEKSKELGLKNTHFANASGLHDEQHYTTAYDMAVILNAAINNNLCRKILSTPTYTTAVTPQHPNGINLRSTLFTYINGDEPETSYIYGGKTGYVNMSGYCIASFGTGYDTNNEYIVVTMGNSARKPAFSGQINLYKQFVK